MPLASYWVLTASGKWHAWPQSGRSTLCGRVNAEHLRSNPALEIRHQAPADGVHCRTCTRKSGGVIRTTTAVPSLDATGAEWVGLLRRHLARTHLNVPDRHLEALARRLNEVGPVTATEAQDVFAQVCALFLTPSVFRGARRADGRAAKSVRGLPHLKGALALIPTTNGALTTLAGIVRIWREVTRRDPANERFNAERVIETMLQVPNAEAYIRHLHARELSHLAAMFHPNTLERARKDPALRGMFGGSTEYWQHTAVDLNIITD